MVRSVKTTFAGIGTRFEFLAEAVGQENPNLQFVFLSDELACIGSCLVIDESGPKQCLKSDVTTSMPLEEACDQFQIKIFSHAITCAIL